VETYSSYHWKVTVSDGDGDSRFFEIAVIAATLETAVRIAERAIIREEKISTKATLRAQMVERVNRVFLAA
jgi:hypothetical protein